MGDPRDRRIEFRTGTHPLPFLGEEASLVAPESGQADAPIATPALPSRAVHTSSAREAASVGLWALAGIVSMSLVLEWTGWQIAFDRSAPLKAAGIPWGSFLRGATDTALGALGVGLVSGVATLLFPSTWRRPWRRIAVGFAGGAAAFLAFLSLLTFSYFL